MTRSETNSFVAFVSLENRMMYLSPFFGVGSTEDGIYELLGLRDNINVTMVPRPVGVSGPLSRKLF
jgi:hypothetical protein